MDDGGTGWEWVGTGFVSARFDKDAMVEASNGTGFDDISASQPEDIAAPTKDVRVCKKITRTIGYFQQENLPPVALDLRLTPHSIRHEAYCRPAQQ